MMRASLHALAAVLVAAAPAAVAAQTPAAAGAPTGAPTIVIVVRHADKAAQPASDPPLTATGVERAQALALMLRDANVAAVLHTPTTRTRETARPTAELFGLTPEVIPMGPAPAMAKSVAALVRKHAGKTILVVGHSNTIMPWIAELGGPKRPDLCDHEYDGLYTLVVDGTGARLVEGHYGPPNPAETAPCATMQMRP